jgi:uncharacterized RDD family membrane protein YckC
MSNGYFIIENGEQSGPFTLKELTERDIENHSKILIPGNEEWQDACDLPELYPYFESIGVYLPTGDNLASFWMRLLAYIADYFILAIVTNYVLQLIALATGKTFAIHTYSDIFKMSISDMILLQIITGVTLIVYNTIGEISPMKGSIGKFLFRLVVVDVEGYGQSFLTALLRNFVKVFSVFFLYLGFLPILFTEHRQSIHDLAAKTYVVRKTIL